MILADEISRVADDIESDVAGWTVTGHGYPEIAEKILAQGDLAPAYGYVWALRDDTDSLDAYCLRLLVLAGLEAQQQGECRVCGGGGCR